MKVIRYKYLPLILLAIVCLWSILPLLHTGFFVSDDGEWMIIRLTAFHQALASGEFPVRWLGRLDFAYGYPVANFLYPGFLYVGELIHLFHISFVNSIKIVIGLSLIGSGFFSYLWLKRFFEPIVASIGAIFYLFAPYHLYDVYVRGSVGENLALAVIVFVFWQIERKSFLLSTLGIGFLILSHNTLAALFLPIVVLYLVLRKKELQYSWREIMLQIFLGLGASAFFWIPALYDLQYTAFAQTIVSDWKSYFALFSLSQPFILSIFIGAVFIIQDRGNFRREIMPLFFLTVTALPLFLSSEFSSFLWMYLPISFIQFPFRLLSVTLLGGTFLSCYLLSHAKNWLPFWAVFTLITIIFSAVPFLTPKQYIDKGEGFYLTNEDSTTVKREYTPIWVKQKPAERPTAVFSAPNATLTPLKVKSNFAQVKVVNSQPTTLTFNQHYFPGWFVFLNGLPLSRSHLHIDNPQGVMQVDVPRDSVVTFEFHETPLRLTADILSLVSLVSIGVLSILFARKKGWKYL
jgi:hypothetical protein